MVQRVRDQAMELVVVVAEVVVVRVLAAQRRERAVAQAPQASVPSNNEESVHALKTMSPPNWLRLDVTRQTCNTAARKGRSEGRQRSCPHGFALIGL